MMPEPVRQEMKEVQVARRMSQPQKLRPLVSCRQSSPARLVLLLLRPCPRRCLNRLVELRCGCAQSQGSM